MIKQFFLLIGLSVGIVLGMSYAHQGIQLLVDAYNWISQLLTDVFTIGQAGNIARGLLALLAIPFLAGFIPAIFYWFIKRHWLPCFMEIIWIVWLIQAGALLMVEKVVTI